MIANKSGKSNQPTPEMRGFASLRYNQILMRILITAGPTREPIDPVRYIGNRSSGKMGAALAEAAVSAGHAVTVVLGPVSISMPPVPIVHVETAAQMQEAVLREFPRHDLLIMAAAVADYRPITIALRKMDRAGRLVIECEPTPDIVALASRSKAPSQRIVGFSLEMEGDLDRAQQKLDRKKLDLMVYNPVVTMDSEQVQAVLLWPDGRRETLPAMDKRQFAEILIERSAKLFVGL